MAIEYQRPVSYAAYWSRRLALFGLFLFLLSLLLHRFGPLTTPHFLAIAALSATLSFVAVLLAAIGLVRLWMVGAKGGKAAFLALLLSILPLGAAGAAGYAYFYRPAIFDVTTDTLDAPPWLKFPLAKQDWLPRPDYATARDRELQLAAYPGLTGRRYDGALDRVYQGVRKVAEENDIVITEESGLENILVDLEDLAVDRSGKEPQSDEIGEVPIPLQRPSPLPSADGIGRSADVLMQGEWRTLIAGFRFDVMIRLREEAETTLVDIRVASRYGPHDLGMGAAFAEAYLKALDAELLGIAGD
ncbi:DUF1499 domain-containing protein [Sinorhizobium sp. BG8]|uniref:DUF1499 domain-containing protein n=1 Tax=Sinorhizobium sp. BG8 TaxID=2613773 RepID=UPI00193E6CAA|nr:DUF1499 domain-containing protein [Sinorhizobium sp. BG8]QRM56843.1 DUF1499 domain-containing protein [Sinorhizobium sp. BG8]